MLLSVDAYPDEDDGLSLALAYRTRALILLTMGEGELALNDLKLSVKHGFKSQDDAEYYLKLTDAYVCKSRIDYQINSNCSSLEN